MQDEFDREFRPENYVTPEEGAERFPDGAAIVACRICNRVLLLRPDDEPDCGMHRN